MPKENQIIELEPLTGLLDAKAQASEYKKRKSSFETKKIHPADVETAIADNWEVARKTKSKIQVRKPKAHHQMLEDRVWCFLNRMGYSYLNQNRFFISMERDNNSIGRKQIDVFSSDAETVFVVECKSKIERGKKSLQKDILETVAIQDYLRKTIYKMYGSNPKPKIIWAYATQNIIWSENDLERANDGNISVITENELQYYEAFLKHMGPAGKYQVLAEFLKEQKIPGMGDVKLPAVKGKIGGDTYYSFVVTPKRLLKIAFVNHQALNHPDGRPAYQRMISSSRIKNIQKFIEGGGYFPTNLLVNFVTSPKFEPLSNKENTDPNTTFGWITLPTKYKSAWIIDGQHRLYGYSHLDDDYLDQSLFVLAFDKMDTLKEANLFITINSKQKSVPKSLLVSLLADLKLGDEDPKTALAAIASGVIRALNSDKTSPFFRRFSIPGVPPDSNQNLTVSEAVNGLVRSGLVGKAGKRNIAPGALSSSTDIKTIDRARRILNGYFDELSASNRTRWEAGKTAFISVNPGIRAHLMLIGYIVQYLTFMRNVDFDSLSEDKFIKYITEIAKPVFVFIADGDEDEIKEKFSRKFGEGGVREYLYNLYSLIHDERNDFGPSDFLQWIVRAESERSNEANQTVMRLSEKMIDCVIAMLRGIHGTKTLPSGDQSFWEIGIESQRVKDNAYKKQQDDKERRKPKEAYVDIVDLIEIIKQKNNWDFFSPIFNLPMSTDKKGGKYYLNWMNNFNELRKIAAHKNSLRTYSDDDLEFLDWLSSELEPKLDAELKKKSK